MSCTSREIGKRTKGFILGELKTLSWKLQQTVSITTPNDFPAYVCVNRGILPFRDCAKQ